MAICWGQYSKFSLCMCVCFYFKIKIAASADSVTTSYSLLLRSPWTSDLPVDTEFGNCDHLELIDGHVLYPYSDPYKYDLSDFLRCPPNETVKRCRITLRGKSHIIWEAFNLCYSEMYHVLSRTFRTGKVQITVSSSEDYGKFNLWQSSYKFREVCAPPGDDLQVVYESVQLVESYDDFCSPDFDRTNLKGVVTLKPVRKATINLISNDLCGRRSSHRGVHSDTGTVVSSYQPEWTTQDLHFCKGRISTEADTKKVCFKFSHFTTYPGGPRLVIRSVPTKLIFDFDNPIRKGSEVCIPTKRVLIVYIQVVPDGKDPIRKFHHDFLAQFRTLSGDDDDDDDSLPKKWIILGVGTISIPFCVGCVYKIEKITRNQNAFSRCASPPTSISVGNEEGIEMAEMVESAMPLTDQRPASPDLQHLLPSYQELYPKGKDCVDSV